MSLIPAVLILQLAVAGPPRRITPVLTFPDPRIDDTTAYQGYRTRFFQDFAGNTVQIYVDNRGGRVVHLLADAENESIGFTVRDSRGNPATVEGAGVGATVNGSSSKSRTLTYDLAVTSPRVSIGWFVLGSMRVERDFQYWGRHKAPFASPRFVLPEMDRLFAALSGLDGATR